MMNVIRKIIIDDKEMSTAEEQDVFDDVHDPKWNDDAEDMVDDGSVETNSRRNVRYLSIYELVLVCETQKVTNLLICLCCIYIG